MKFVKYFTLCSLFSSVGFISPANAITFEFNFPDSAGTEGGTLTGTVELPKDSGSDLSAESLTIDSAPGDLSRFNGLELINNSDYDVKGTSFNVDDGEITNSDVVIVSKNRLSSINNNFLALRLRRGDPTFPVNSFGASTTDEEFDSNGPDIVDGNSFEDPFIQNDASNVTYEQVQAVPFEAEGTMGLVALGGYVLYRHRKKRKQALNQ